MKILHKLIAAALAVVLGAVTLPALAETPGGSQMMPSEDMGMGPKGHGMTGGMMSGDMMGGCMGMIRSMNNGDGRPNSQWHKRGTAERSMPN
jgi:hypothetical protein